ncbi:hypothetical protein Tco_1058021 [Tanacetum coccineum]|uniref:Uncharacterized protein n=1 Tax=Tanacetum coccineum TaxID=301880 RepID=A0ABQ5H781_9ASTR
MPNRNNDDDDRGLLWKLPAVYSDKLGKVGPAFGLGAGCGLGFGVGLIGDGYVPNQEVVGSSPAMDENEIVLVL